ncbi:hypothetical protein FRB93_011328 [Tulasnella sp. JGI-2019a]|nr:hypothetical protein FRB93_011328 [Tulasnella sp. JGI-2019a]
MPGSEVTISAPISNGKVAIPKGLEGIVYAVVSTNSTAATDDTTKAGPTVFAFPVGFWVYSGLCE